MNAGPARSAFTAVITPAAAHPFAEMLRQVHAQAAKPGGSAASGANATASTAAKRNEAEPRHGDAADGASAGNAASQNGDAAAAKARARTAPPPGKRLGLGFADAPTLPAAPADGADPLRHRAAADGEADVSRTDNPSTTVPLASGLQASRDAAIVADDFASAASGKAALAGDDAATGRARTSAGATDGDGASGNGLADARSRRQIITAERTGPRAGAQEAAKAEAASTRSVDGAQALREPIPHAAFADAASAVAALGQTAPPPATATNTPPPAPAAAQASVATPIDAPGFATAFGVQVSVLAREGVQRAELHLNPAEMGPVSIRISIEGREARVDFGADVAATRQAIEASLPNLAGALSDAGFTLAGGGVSQHAGSQGGRDGAGDEGSGTHDPNGGSSAPAAHASGQLTSAASRMAAHVAAGGLDLYA